MINLFAQHIIGNFKVHLSYKVASFTGLFGAVMQTILLYFFWSNVFHADDFTIKYVVYARIVYFFIGSNVWGMANEIRNGNIAIFLSKPLGFFRYSFVMFFTARIVAFFIQCVPFIALTVLLVPLTVTPLQVLLFMMSVSAALVICFCVDYLFSLLCVITNSIWGISALRDGMIQILSGAIIPLYLMPEHFQNTLRILPFAYMVDTPIRILTTSDYQVHGLIIQLTYCIVILCVAIFAESRFAKRLQVQGG